MVKMCSLFSIFVYFTIVSATFFTIYSFAINFAARWTH